MGLTREEAENLREGDTVLVMMVVERTNNHFDDPMGTKVVCTSVAQDHRPREEREEKGPRKLDIMSRFIYSVSRRPIRVNDWVKFTHRSVSGLIGKVRFISDEVATIKPHPQITGEPVNVSVWLAYCDRTLPPKDLSDKEKKAFA
jgi:hypothetical protein